MPLPAPVDPCRCPLCGQPNHCALMRSDEAEGVQACWCTQAVFGAELLQRVPPAAQRKACICQACVQASQAPA